MSDTTKFNFEGNEAFMELYNALEEKVGAVEAAKCAASVYKKCGARGYLLPGRA